MNESMFFLFEWRVRIYWWILNDHARGIKLGTL